jgi:hypothetical protein
MQLNKLTLLGGALLASIMFEPIAASAYDVFSYRYDYTKQSDSPAKESRSSKLKSVEFDSVAHKSTSGALRAVDTSANKENRSENLKPNTLADFSSKRELFSNPRK